MQQWSLTDFAFAWHLLHSKRFTDTFGGGLLAKSCLPLIFEGCLTVDTFPEPDFWFCFNNGNEHAHLIASYISSCTRLVQL